MSPKIEISVDSVGKIDTHFADCALLEAIYSTIGSWMERLEKEAQLGNGG